MKGFTGLLTVLFIGLKLTGFIAWSWVWVLAPLWIGIAIELVFLIVAALLGGLSVLASSTKKRI